VLVTETIRMARVEAGKSEWSASPWILRTWFGRRLAQIRLTCEDRSVTIHSIRAARCPARSRAIRIAIARRWTMP